MYCGYFKPQHSFMWVWHEYHPPQVRLQVQNVDKPLYRGTFHCFQSIIRQESVSFLTFLLVLQSNRHSYDSRKISVAFTARRPMQCSVTFPSENTCIHQHIPISGWGWGGDWCGFLLSQCPGEITPACLNKALNIVLFVEYALLYGSSTWLNSLLKLWLYSWSISRF